MLSADAVHVQELSGPTPDEMAVEIVERKGLGHPDTICDQVMEQVSQALCRAYLSSFQRILHHNCDKGLLIAGQVERRFGGGRVTEPMRLVIGDRAAPVKEFDVSDIAVDAAKRWFRQHLPRIDAEHDIKYQVELRGGSDELTDIFRRSTAIAAANDTSAAVGYAPLTATERLVLDAERFLNGPQFKTDYPDTGTDVKVMAVRSGAKLTLTVAMPLLDRYVHGEQSYFRRKEEVRAALLADLNARREKNHEIVIYLNALDRPQAGIQGMYLSVLGTSAEDADSGQVGRGNQVNGIIALNRPRGSEAAAGKNPVSHVGKIYSVLTHLLAEQIYREVPGLRQVTVWLCARIGDPVDQPQVAAVQVALDARTKLMEIQTPIRRILIRELERIPDFCEALTRGEYSIC